MSRHPSPHYGLQHAPRPLVDHPQLHPRRYRRPPAVKVEMETVSACLVLFSFLPHARHLVARTLALAAAPVLVWVGQTCTGVAKASRQRAGRAATPVKLGIEPAPSVRAQMD